MRLRPSGNAGPLATSLSGFTSYHRDNAWTWEHLALSRARVIFADDALGYDVNAAITTVMTRARGGQDPGRRHQYARFDGQGAAGAASV